MSPQDQHGAHERWAWGTERNHTHLKEQALQSRGLWREILQKGKVCCYSACLGSPPSLLRSPRGWLCHHTADVARSFTSFQAKAPALLQGQSTGFAQGERRGKTQNGSGWKVVL